MPARLRRSTLLFYCLPQMALAALHVPLLVHLPPFYAAHLGIGLTAVGAIFMIARFWDVFTDPVFGLIADKWRSRIGVRRPWMILAAPILMVSSVWVFFPPSMASEAYITGGLLFLFVGWTIASISYHSWGAELSTDYDERGRIQGAVQFAVLLATIIVLVFPSVIEAIPGTTPAMEVGSMGLFVLLAVPVTFFLAVWKVPDHHEPIVHTDMKEAKWAIFKNAALRRILIADLAGGFGQGSTSALFLFYAKDVLQLDDRANVLLLFYFVSGLLCGPIWVWLARRMQKHTALCISAFYNVVTLGLLFILPPGRVDLAAIVIVLQGVNLASVPLLMRSCMADVVDEDALRTGYHRNGLFFSLLTLTAKIGGAMTIGVNYFILDLIGFDAQGGNDAGTVDALRILFVTVPLLTSTIMFAVMLRFPIGRIEQTALRDELARRSAERRA